MNVPTLFDAPAARRTDDQTSHDAAARVAPVAAGIEKQIIELLGTYRALTKNECCELLKVDPKHWPTVASALSRLKNAGHVGWTGDRRDGQNVWRLRVATVRATGDVL